MSKKNHMNDISSFSFGSSIDSIEPLGFILKHLNVWSLQSIAYSKS